MTYLEQVPAIANRLAINAFINEEHRAFTPSWQSLADTWQRLEAHAAMVHYDVLEGKAFMGGGTAPLAVHKVLPEIVDKMIHLLYQLENDPKDAALLDYILLVEKDESYGASWKKRGGPGAFFVTVRKWDRLMQFKGQFGAPESVRELCKMRSGGERAWDTVRDLRCYLLLWQAERASR